MRTIAATLFALALGLGFTAGWAEDAAKPETVTADKLPAAVKETFDKEEKGGEIKEIKKITDGTKVKYQIHYVLEGKKHVVTILEDGKLAKGHGDAEKGGDAK